MDLLTNFNNFLQFLSEIAQMKCNVYLKSVINLLKKHLCINLTLKHRTSEKLFIFKTKQALFLEHEKKIRHMDNTYIRSKLFLI